MRVRGGIFREKEGDFRKKKKHSLSYTEGKKKKSGKKT